MANVHNEKFKKDPRDFAEKYPISPKKAEDAWNLSGTNVSGGGTIKYASLATNQGVLSLAFVEESVGAVKTMLLKVANADAFPSHYLPYANGFIVDYQIPEKDAKTDNDDPANPRFFFTTALSGCSIFVRGGTRSPIVTHAGMESPPANKPAWKDLLTGHLKITDPVTAVNKQDYRLADEIIEASKKKTVKTISTFACVFGVREDDGEWKFYLQVGRMQITERPKKPTSYTPLTPQVSQFYPTGVAQVHPA
ncbi:MAG: hypothetical protein NTU53_18040 [Planctomycetota bacterium]|nr:hypothetical protein [Planctomycetota bacterium]